MKLSSINKAPWLEWIAGFSACVAVLYMALNVFFLNLDKMPLRMWDESRIAVNAQEIHSLKDVLVLKFQGQPDMWNTKPPLLASLMKAGYVAFGENEFAVRLPSALAGFGCCVVIILFFYYRLDSLWTGLMAVLALITSNGFVVYHVARHGDFDSMISFWVLLAVLCHFVACRHSENPKRWMAAMSFSLFAAMMTKGIAGGIVIPALFLWGLLEHKSAQRRYVVHMAIAVAVPVSMVAAFYILRDHFNPGYLKSLYENELVGRYLSTSESHVQPFWFYLDEYFYYSFKPWIWILLITMPAVLTAPAEWKRFFLSVLSVLVFFILVISSSATKLHWYAAPTYPLLATVTAVSAASAGRWIWQSIRVRWLRVVAAAAACTLAMLYYTLNYEQLVDHPLAVTQETTYPELYYAGLFRHYYGNYPEDAKLVAVSSDYNSHLVFYVQKYRRMGREVTVCDPGCSFSAGEVLLIPDSRTYNALSNRYVLKDLYDGYGRISTVEGPMAPLYARDTNRLNRLVEEKMQEIRNTPEWFEAIRKKAAERGIDTDDQVMLDAVWILEKDNLLDHESADHYVKLQGR